MGRHPCRDQRQSEGEAAAPDDDLRRRLRFPVDSSAAQPTSQQLVCFAGVHGAHREWVSALGGNQSQQPVAAGDDHPSRVATGKKRPNLLGVPGIVQHNEDSSVGDQAPVETDLLRQAHRDPVRRDGQRVQEDPDRLAWLHRLRRSLEAAQVEVELAVREPRSHAVGPVDRQRGLAHPSGAGHRGDHDRRRLAVLGQEQVKAGDLSLPPHERRHGHGQQGRRWG